MIYKRMIRACPHIRAMRIEFYAWWEIISTWVEWKERGRENGKTTFLWRVKIFYFFLFLDNSKLYFCAHKSGFCPHCGISFRYIVSIRFYHFDMSFRYIDSILLAMTIEHPQIELCGELGFPT